MHNTQNSDTDLKDRTDGWFEKIRFVIDKSLPGIAFSAVAIFFLAMISFIRKNSHFICDDLDFFDNILHQSLRGLLTTPDNVHYFPFAKLSTLLIFKIAPLNFDAALVVSSIYWLIIVWLIHRLLSHLTSARAALLITVFIGTSPAWLHVLIWWGAEFHRLPYMLFQAAALLSYLRYRQSEKPVDAILCIMTQLLGMGFYQKAILFPIVLAAFEVCFGYQKRKFSLAGLRLCTVMAAVSAIYVGWYLLFAPVARFENNLGILGRFNIVLMYISWLGRVLLFMPKDKLWAGLVSGVFWIAIGVWSIRRRPQSVVPIGMLLFLLIMDFGVSTARGILIYPTGNLRFFAEELVIIAVFVGLSTVPHIVEKETNSRIYFRRQLSWHRGWLERFLPIGIALLIIAYPLGSYCGRLSTKYMYKDFRQTHKFMINLKKSLSVVSSGHTSITLLKSNFPVFIYGFGGGRKPLYNILGPLYPQIKWVELKDVPSMVYNMFGTTVSLFRGSRTTNEIKF